MVVKKDTFQAYRDSTLDTPITHSMFRSCIPCLYVLFIRTLLPIRWFLSQPFQIRIYPRFLPPTSFPEYLPYVTIGQIILALPNAYFLYSGYLQTFVTTDVNQTGHTASFALVLTYLTAFKSNSIFSYFFGIPYERMIYLHNLSAVTSVFLGVVHTYVAFVFGGSTDEADNSQYSVYAGNPKLLRFCFDNKKNASGTILISFMMLLVGTSFFPSLRRLKFNFWIIIHSLSAVCVVIFSFQHKVNVIVITSVFWIIDLFMRRIIMVLNLPKKAKITKVLPDVVELRFPKGAKFDYKSGQHVCVNIPKVGLLEYHPITISSAPHESDITLHVKALGDWSRKLCDLCDEENEVTILLEGPYGNLSVDLNDHHKYRFILMISGGIGVTPCQSLAKSLLYQSERGRRLAKIHYVWAVRDTNLVSVLSPVLKTDQNQFLDTEWVSQDIIASNLTTPLMSEEEEKKESSSFNNQSTRMDEDYFELPSEEDPHLKLKVDVYKTKINSDDLEHNQEKSGSFNFHNGRPDLNLIFTQAKEEAIELNLSHIAVICCGPVEMTKEVREAARLHSRNDIACCGVAFDLHEEIFEY